MVTIWFNAQYTRIAISAKKKRERESSSKGIFKSDASVPQEVFYDSVDSNKAVEPVVQSTQLNSDSEIESEPQEALAPRRSSRSTRGAPSTR